MTIQPCISTHEGGTWVGYGYHSNLHVCNSYAHIGNGNGKYGREVGIWVGQTSKSE